MKPPNILVNSGGVPKLLDFGIAKLLNPEQTVSGVTATSFRAMTPDYASPEQVRGESVTFSSDIYSLGIILYELLTGKRPYRVNYLQPLQIMRAVCETEPEKPSAMVSQSVQVNHNGDFAPKVLQRRLKGDLDNIVLMALRKEPAARYPSAEAFSDDIGRHLTGHPVRARRAMRQFRIKKIIRNRFTLFAAAVLILAMAASVLSFRVFRRSLNPISNQQSRIRSIAVLPFEPISSNQRDEYLEQGIADALITRLSGLRQIIVRPTSAVQQYSHSVQDPLALGKKLKVDAVLSGNVQQSENQLRVMARVTRTSDGQILWSEQYDSQISAIFALQDLICEEVARALTPLNGKEQEHLKKRETESVEAYQSYLKGRYFLSQRNPEGYAQALKYFTQATQQDPHFALAYVGLANASQFLADFQLPRMETMRKVKACLLKALEIDPTLPEAHASLALFEENYDWDWPGALKEYRQVLALKPNFSQAHHWYGEFLVQMGRFDEGISELKRALEIDPLSLIINTDLAKCLYFERHYSDALIQLNKTFQIDPNYFMARVWLASVYLSQKNYKHAISVLEQLEPSDHQSLGTFGLAAYAYGLSGNQIEAKKILAMLTEESKHRHIAMAGLVNLYIGLGEKDQAFSLLEQEYSQRSSDLLGLKTIPLWDPLRSDPRYDDLMRRVGFLKPLPN